ncbi:MAG TPA: thioredoxin domain-containing protein [Pyrinomonadaceae bacterium]|jgi:protein-disulfide isomerase|nr:thioredoxin domain-containing protein [Pyrinomonadaceae bacterium]
MQKYRPILIIASVLLAAIVGGTLLFKSGRNKDPFTLSGPQQSPSPQTERQRTLPVETIVTLEEFGDYQCPPCGALHPTLKKLKQDLGPNLNFVFRNLPLTTIHKNALTAARAAEAARIQNRFWEMHDLLYENQELWKEDINPRTIFVKFAADLGLDTTRFAQDMDDKQVQLRIEADQDAASQLGIIGTPTVLIDGRQMRPEVTTPEGIRKGIELMMARKVKPTP